MASESDGVQIQSMHANAERGIIRIWGGNTTPFYVRSGKWIGARRNIRSSAFVLWSDAFERGNPSFYQHPTGLVA
jgi:hypothetical protein